MNVTGRTIRWLVITTYLAGVVADRSAALARPCWGDCDGEAGVTVEEIIRVVGIALGDGALDTCPFADGNADGIVTIEDVIGAVNDANDGTCASNPDASVCGNGVVEVPEDCDDGGICVGGRSAGTACTADDTCGREEPGVCEAGSSLGAACRTNADCSGSRCVRCRTFGGDGCATNCTFETSVTFDLVSGVVQGLDIRPGTSGLKIYGDVVSELPLWEIGMQTLTIGKQRHGQIPLVIKAASVQFSKAPLGTGGCVCIRAFAAKTCGGAAFDEAGHTAVDCSFDVPSPVACPPERPCTFVHGPGNSASGMIGCDGLEAIDRDTVLTCNLAGGAASVAGLVVAGPPGPSGSATLLNSLHIDTHTGSCLATDCTDADPLSSRRGVQATHVYTTGRLGATTRNVSGLPGNDISCGTQGAPFRCADLSAPVPRVSGVNLAAAYSACGTPTLGDLCIVNNLVAR